MVQKSQTTTVWMSKNRRKFFEPSTIIIHYRYFRQITQNWSRLYSLEAQSSKSRKLVFWIHGSRNPKLTHKQGQSLVQMDFLGYM